MVRFDPADPLTTKLPPPIRSARRRSPRRGGGRAGAPRRVSRRPTHCWNKRFRPGRGRRNSQPSAPTRASRRLSAPAPGSLCWIKFFALDPPFAGALRQRLALRAATACAALARLARIFPRCATPSISRRAGDATPAPPDASIGCGAVSRARPPRLDAPTLRTAADLLGLSDADRASRGSPTPCGTSRRRRTAARGGRGRERRGDETS